MQFSCSSLELDVLPNCIFTLSPLLKQIVFKLIELVFIDCFEVLLGFKVLLAHIFDRPQHVGLQLE